MSPERISAVWVLLCIGEGMFHHWRERMSVRVCLFACVFACVLAASMLVGVAPANAQTPAAFRTLAPAALPVHNDVRLQRWLDTHRGKPIVLNFWASWCAPCRDEMPALQTLAHRGWPVLTIAVADKPIAAREFLRTHAPTVAQIDDPEQTLSRALGVNSVPTTLILDAQHRLRFVAKGAIVPESPSANDIAALGDLLQSLSSP
jgi:thiol-disulfide isomerase/thioredoxin